MRKMLSIILAAGIITLTAGSLFALREPYGSDVGYVIVKCTVTVDVDVLDNWSTAWFIYQGNMNNGLSAGQTDVSVTSITVKNNSSGAIVKYAVLVSSIQRNSATDGSGNWISDDDDTTAGIKGWYLSTDGIADSPGEFILWAVFSKNRPNANDFLNNEANDQFRVNLANSQPSDSQLRNYTYRSTNGNFGPETPANQYSSALSGSANNLIAPNEERGLWFKITTPASVTDVYPRRISVVVYGGLGSSW
jgi:hypothetical protein